MWGATIKQIKKKKKSTQNILVFEAAEEQTQSVRLCQSNMKAPSVLQSKNRQKKEPIVFACFNRQDSSRKWPTDLVVSESAFPKTYVQARDRQLETSDRTETVVLLQLLSVLNCEWKTNWGQEITASCRNDKLQWKVFCWRVKPSNRAAPYYQIQYWLILVHQVKMQLHFYNNTPQSLFTRLALYTCTW